MMCVCCAESEFEDDAVAEDEVESGSGEDEAPDKGVAAGKKRAQRSSASRRAAETAALPRIDFFFKRPANAPSSSAPAATGASSAEVASSPSLGSPAGLSPAGSSAAPAASTASPGQSDASPAEDSASPAVGSAAPSTDCPICLSPIDAHATRGAACMTLACGHSFHGDCIIKWLRTAQTSCPVCRSGPSADSPHPKPPKTAETGKEAVTPAAATMETEMETETDAPRSGHSANGVKLGRPPGSGGGSISRAESAASHKGLGPRSLGGSTHESKAARGSTRQLRAAIRPRSELEPPAPALPAPTRPKRADAGVQRGPQLLPHVPVAILAKLRRINHDRQLERADVVGGEALSPGATPDYLLQRLTTYYYLLYSYLLCHPVLIKFSTNSNPDHQGLLSCNIPSSASSQPTCVAHSNCPNPIQE